MKVLVTGGAGYIGSHAVVALIEADHEVVIVDNFMNSDPDVLDAIETITAKRPQLYKVDMTDAAAINDAISDFKPQATIHFAALKAVGESVEQPLHYHRNNDIGLINTLNAAVDCGVESFIFSSSATVYGDPQTAKIVETHPISSLNPYGSTKIIAEQILQDAAAAYPEVRIVALRYFNPVGAHDSGLIGDDPKGIPNNIAPYIVRVASGEIDKLTIFGDDYDTVDGTGVRDYIHVLDLVDGHIAALEKAQKGFSAYNLGSGSGYSVKQLLASFEKAAGKPIAHVVGDRRPGDSAMCVADSSKAEKDLGWKTTRTLDQMCQSAWNFVSQNAN